YRLEVVEDGVHARGLLGTRHLPWTAVAHVELRSDALVLADAHAAALEIGTSGLTADQRASLERTVARRVRGTGQAAAGAREPSPGQMKRCSSSSAIRRGGGRWRVSSPRSL